MGRVWKFAFLISSQVLLLVWGLNCTTENIIVRLPIKAWIHPSRTYTYCKHSHSNEHPQTPFIGSFWEIESVANCLYSFYLHFIVFPLELVALSYHCLSWFCKWILRITLQKFQRWLNNKVFSILVGVEAQYLSSVQFNKFSPIPARCQALWIKGQKEPRLSLILHNPSGERDNEY